MKLKITLSAETRENLTTARAEVVARLKNIERFRLEAEQTADEETRWQREYEAKMQSVDLRSDADIDALNRLNVRRQLAPERAVNAANDLQRERGSLVHFTRGITNEISTALRPTFDRVVDEAAAQLANLFPEPNEARANALASQPVRLFEGYIAGSYQPGHLEAAIMIIDEILSGEIEIGGVEQPSEAAA